MNKTQREARANGLCEICGRPDSGKSRCAHAMDERIPCPNDPKRQSQLRNMRRIGLG